jgi:hypothetical protein
MTTETDECVFYTLVFFFGYAQDFVVTSINKRASHDARFCIREVVARVSPEDYPAIRKNEQEVSHVRY